MDLQELITRGRFLFSSAPARLAVFELVNGRRTAAEIAQRVGRPVNSIRNDLRVLSDGELIRPKLDRHAEPLKSQGSLVFEKTPLARTVKSAYFKTPVKLPGKESPAVRPSTSRTGTRPSPPSVPTETQLLDICKEGEDQGQEFKGQGTDARKLAKEVAAMLTTRSGGLILYGVDDQGTIEGTDISRQRLDQSLQNAVRNSISPAPVIKIRSVPVLGSEVLVVIVPPWNRRDVYQYEGRVLIRKGTNAFMATPEESRKLHRGEYVI